MIPLKTHIKPSLERNCPFIIRRYIEHMRLMIEYAIAIRTDYSVLSRTPRTIACPPIAANEDVAPKQTPNFLLLTKSSPSIGAFIRLSTRIYILRSSVCISTPRSWLPRRSRRGLYCGLAATPRQSPQPSTRTGRPPRCRSRQASRGFTSIAGLWSPVPSASCRLPRSRRMRLSLSSYKPTTLSSHP
eukprot:scaffold155137_cov37-Prasinocladus_malaysianus.AAC.1